MIRRSWLVCCLAGWLLFDNGPIGSVAADSKPAAPLRVGVAVTDITPEEGATHDPLLAKAIVFAQGDCRAALVVCDQAAVHADLSNAVRRLAAEKAGIPAAHVSLTATHTHTGLKHRKDAARRIADAIHRAWDEAAAATFHTGTARQKDVISFNRRFLMKDGAVRFNPGVLNPDIVRPVGPIDPDVGIVLVREAATVRPVASLLSFALHLDTVGKYTEYAADYPYYLQNALRVTFGNDFVSIFGTGCCGDVNHVDVTRPNLKWKHTRGQTMLTPFQPKPTDAPPSPVTTEYIGAALAKTFQEFLPKLKPSRPMLSVRSRTVQVPLATYSEMDLAWAKSVKEPGSFLLGVRARRILALEGLRQKFGDKIGCEVHVFRLSEDTAVVTLPGEIFVELGQAVKKASPFANTLVLELANDSQIAYVPTRKAFCEGDYEVVNSRLECGGGEMLVEAAVQMLKELRPQAAK